MNNKKINEYKKRFEDQGKKEYKIINIEEKTNYSSKTLLVKHLSCGKTFLTSFNNFLGTKNRKGRRCPHCRGGVKKSFKEIKEKISQIDGGEYKLLSSEYNNNKEKLKIKHLICGETFEVRGDNFINLGTRCPFCKRYKKELEIRTFLLKYLNKEDIIINDRVLLNNKREIDFYVPKKRIAIEFNGLYWHSDKFKEKNYHLNKSKELEEKGIRLIHIFEDEWIEKKEIVKSKIISIMKLNEKKERIFARKCNLKIISPNEKRDFLKENHIQGNDNSQINLGLFYKDELISVMTFCKQRLGIGKGKSNNIIYELSRFANKKNLIIIGGFEKLFKYFKKNYVFDEIISYADLRWSSKTSNIYLKNKFTEKFINRPNYWYCDKKKRFHRFSFRKTMLKKRFPEIFEKNLTEFEIIDKTNFTRIWDCGTITYSYKNKLS